jgi:hypothetical protein
MPQMGFEPTIPVFGQAETEKRKLYALNILALKLITSSAKLFVQC